MTNIKKKKILAILILGLIVFPAILQAQMMKEVVARSLYADKKAFNEGDIITVLIVEFAKGSNSTNTSTNSDNRLTADANSSGNLTSMLPSFGLNSQLSNKHEAQGETSTKGSLESKMTAIVTEVMENGLLSVQGTRQVDVNGEVQTTVLTGLVRPEDVRTDNTVYSYNIANAVITYKGKGMATTAGSPGILARLWNWIF
jgi:flagellar L-ring protein precursor FlgH